MVDMLVVILTGAGVAIHEIDGFDSYTSCKLAAEEIAESRPVHATCFDRKFGTPEGMSNLLRVLERATERTDKIEEARQAERTFRCFLDEGECDGSDRQ